MVRQVPYGEAAVVLEKLGDRRPPALRKKTAADLEREWPAWVLRRDADIRARLERGEEDSVINLLSYGTSFTTQPRLTGRDDGSGGSSEQRVLRARVDDLVAGIARPEANARLRFAREVVERRGIDPGTATGRERLRAYLLEGRARSLAEYALRTRRWDASKRLSNPRAELETYFTLFHDRGLSSDTLLSSGFAIEVALGALKLQHPAILPRVQRVGIVGPGLDFADKADGYDVYPEQTIQPFAVIESLLRLGLSEPGSLRMTTFDVSARVNRHIQSAVASAEQGTPYHLELPLNTGMKWNPALVRYWQRFGEHIGAETTATMPPPNAGAVRIRGVGIRPELVRAIDPAMLNIVLERDETAGPAGQFDLIIATNVLVYYDVFEQNLALANIARMLRPGGVLLSNTLVTPAIPLRLLDDYYKVVFRTQEGDRMFVYRRDEGSGEGRAISAPQAKPLRDRAARRP